MLNLTKHAREQAARRSVSHKDIEYVLSHGVLGHQHGGRTFMFCGKKCSEEGARNLAVVLSPDGAVITVIRTTSLKRLRAKGAYGHAFHVG